MAGTPLPLVGWADFLPRDAALGADGPELLPMRQELEADDASAPVEQGHPVMLLNFGDSCDLAYEVPGSGKPKVVRMESGDSVLFGGVARRLKHAPRRLVPNPEQCLRLLPGRLLLTVRVR